jgi:putative transposase
MFVGLSAQGKARYPPGNNYLPFRRNERSMQRFRRKKSLQKLATFHTSLHDHFASERHLVDRQTYKQPRSAAWAQWRNLMA